MAFRRDVWPAICELWNADPANFLSELGTLFAFSDKRSSPQHRDCGQQMCFKDQQETNYEPAQSIRWADLGSLE